MYNGKSIHSKNIWVYSALISGFSTCTRGVSILCLHRLDCSMHISCFCLGVAVAQSIDITRALLDLVQQVVILKFDRVGYAVDETLNTVSLIPLPSTSK
jgi:hypothetical protein